MTWQPIKTAPEAFIDVLLWNGDDDLGLGFLTEEGDWILKCRVNSVPYEGGLPPATPTHWMHLPEPPEEE